MYQYISLMWHIDVGVACHQLEYVCHTKNVSIEFPEVNWHHCSLKQSLRWRHNDHAGVSNHQPHGCLLNRLFRRKSKKTSKLRVTGLCAGNSPGTGEFPAQMASNAENVSIWWRHLVLVESQRNRRTTTVSLRENRFVDRLMREKM